ncbi:MAG: ubiquinol-cytochrome C chaperone family protein [Synergistaceae bacterium]|nr:ubiquinol-cytochrome C chaperone family protein [Synergistaceae bacterium]
MEKDWDKDLNPVLEKASDLELLPIVEQITKKLSNFIEIDENYKNAPDKPTKYVDIIASEIRSMGGNTFANLCRLGSGPSYKEVVCDVADELKVNYNQKADVAKIEGYIMQKVFEDMWEEMSLEDREKIINEVAPNLLKGSAGGAAITLQMLFKAGKFESYKLSLIFINAISKFLFGRGLSLALNASMTKALSIITGPVGMFVTGIWTAVDIAGPSYKTTVWCVLIVAMLRDKQTNEALLAEYA